MFNKHLLPGVLDKAVTKINQFPVLMVLTLVGRYVQGRQFRRVEQHVQRPCGGKDPGSRYLTQTLVSELQFFQLPAKGCSKHTYPPSEHPAQSLPWLSHVQWIKSKVLSPSLGSTWSQGSVLLSLRDSHSRSRPQALPPSRCRPTPPHYWTVRRVSGVGWL